MSCNASSASPYECHEAQTAPMLWRKGTKRIPSFSTEFGVTMLDVDIAYETFGSLAPDGANAILVCHALTGDAHAGDGGGRPGWWGELIGPGKALDTERYFVVCANVLGGCAGTTGPASLIPVENVQYGPDFPVITIRDMVCLQYELLRSLDVACLQLVLGGSMGGMQALEWGVMYPDFCKRLAVMAATPIFSTIGIAYNQVMLEAIVSDPQYCDGNYARYGVFPEAGLRVARMLGMITYRTAQLFALRFGREEVKAGSGDFQVGRYLRHQGDKLVQRFDANSYLTLMKAMDLHDITRGRGDLQTVLAAIRPILMFVGIDEDLLYPPQELQEMARLAASLGARAFYRHIASDYGHDAFLLEFDQLTEMMEDLLARS